MPAREILLLGNPLLRAPCSSVRDIKSSQSQAAAADLHETLSAFQASHGFGRGIAAPQIGISRRIIYIDAEFHGALFNPRIIHRSRRMFRLWDDCFSFPELLVEVRRHSVVTVAYQDPQGERKTITATGSLSELFQHEIDHLDGILAIDRAVDMRHLMLRSEFTKHFPRDTRAL